jgi:hypothetical protein
LRAWKTSDMKVLLMPEMVDDGAVPELSVGDPWLIDLVFRSREPMQPMSSGAKLRIKPQIPLNSDPHPRCLLTARVLRRRPEGSEVTAIALEVPGMIVGYGSRLPLPDTPLVEGDGVLWADPWQNTAWAFPETERRCIVEGLDCVSAPRVQSDDDFRNPDWSRHTTTTIERIRTRHDFPHRQLESGFYVAKIALA